MTDSRRKLRVLQIAETYPPDYGGGAAVYIQDVCRTLAARGHDVRVLCATNVADAEPYAVCTDYDDTIRIDRINLPYFKTLDPEGWLLGLRRWRTHQRRIVALVEGFMRDATPDVIQYNAARPFGEECLAMLSGRGIPVVAMLHEAWVFCPRVMLLRSPTSESCPGPHPLRCLECVYSHYDGSHFRAALKLPWRLLKLGVYPAFRLWRRAVARRTLAGAIAYSRYMARMAQASLSVPVAYVPLGINLAGLPRERPSRPRTPLRFGFIGGDQPNKGIDQVLTAVAALRNAGHDFRLHVWGPGCDRLEAEIARRALTDCVYLHGTYTHSQIWDVYGEMDVALMATLVSEPFGRVVQEAAAIGAPTIAPDVGGISEQIRHDVDGLLYRFRDAGDLERQMRRILTEPPLYARLVGNLPCVGDTCDLAIGVEEFYFQILGPGRDKRFPIPLDVRL